ncbi:MAG: XdhC family protein, partial [Desulfobulbus sp.]|nr:XdhC family protein [Desulfobulbus sp.]
AQEIDSDSYLVIVTRGHLHDLEVLEQALRTRAGYIGMIGSRRKRDSIYTRLLDRGVTEAQLEQVRCPIGMTIEADTPEEIAVSIVGELIYQRATGRRA